MSAPRKLTLSDLRRAAIVVRESGVAIDIEGPDGSLYRIRPEADETPMGATQRESDECDKAFGL